MNTSLNVAQKLDFITEGLSAKVLVNFKNYSYSKYKRSIDPFYYQMKANSFDPETNEYDLETLKTGKYFIEESDHKKNRIRLSIWMHGWTGNVVSDIITLPPWQCT